MQADTSIEVAKVILLLLMIAVAGAATYLTSALNTLIRPISRQLIELHKGDTGGLEQRLQYIRQRYIALLSHVDNIDTAEFSAGEIERLSIRILGREITAASAHSWIHQAPGILISLGLLGTFWGLTVGLGEISGVLTRSLNPAEAMNALSAIVAPMGTAFQTSLLGLLLSLIVLIISQLSGARTCLERCESLLSSWLETVLPQELGDKLMTPLKKSIDGLNATANQLPAAISQSVEEAMQAAFADKLAKMFNLSSTIAVEGQRATRQLSAVATNLNESGQDFVMAARAFQQSNFPEALKESIAGILETKERITASSEGLSSRMQEVRDSLLMMQTQWQLLAKSAETELETCRLVNKQMNEGLVQLQKSSERIVEGVEVTALAAKQLKETRLEVMRDRKLSIDVAESVRERLAADSSASDTCNSFAQSLEKIVTKWEHNYDEILKTHDAIAKTFKGADSSTLQSASQTWQPSKPLSKVESTSGDQFTTQELSNDLAIAVNSQIDALTYLDKPYWKITEVHYKKVKELAIDVLKAISKAKGSVDIYLTDQNKQTLDK